MLFRYMLNVKETHCDAEMFSSNNAREQKQTSRVNWFYCPFAVAPPTVECPALQPNSPIAFEVHTDCSPVVLK